jgi:RNA polymerase sigma factor (TIGR02999 family)
LRILAACRNIFVDRRMRCYAPIRGIIDLSEPTPGASAPGEITVLLEAAQGGDRAAFDAIYHLAYAELKRLAHAVRAGRGSLTLNTTELLHEAYLKLLPAPRGRVHGREHFFRIAARAMRQVLVDAARRRNAQRRGGGAPVILLHESSAEVQPTATNRGVEPEQIIALEEALTRLEEWSPRQASVVECRVFAGLSIEETARALDISTPTVKRDWQTARAWLAQALGQA